MGHFSRLPAEIRIRIWQSLIDDYLDTSSKRLGVLIASRAIQREVDYEAQRSRLLSLRLCPTQNEKYHLRGRSRIVVC